MHRFNEKVVNGEQVERAVCDYIAGMTDRYIVAIYKHHFIPKGWTLTL